MNLGDQISIGFLPSYRHALSFDFNLLSILDVVVADDLNVPIVQVLDVPLETQNGLLQTHRHRNLQVILLPFEKIVRVLLESHDHISRIEIETLLGFSLEHHLVSVHHPLLHFKLQISRPHHYLFTFANWAFVVASLPTPVALLAVDLHLLEFSLHLHAPLCLSTAIANWAIF